MKLGTVIGRVTLAQSVELLHGGRFLVVSPFSREQYATVIGIDRAAWQQELALHTELFKTLEYHLPAELPATKARIEALLAG